MIKTLLAQVKEYKKQSLLSPLFAALEVFFDVSIPFVISLLVDKGIQAGNMQHVILYSFTMLVLATCGDRSQRSCSRCKIGTPCPTD